MKCATCETDNPTDSKFCHACGSRLTPKEAEAPPVEEPQPAAEAPSAEEQSRRRQRVAELLPRAFAFAEKGALVEAIATAEEAAGLVPGSSAAHALLATLYERAGQSEKAILALKKVAELNPDAPLDEERMARLRRARTASAPEKSPERDEAPSPVRFWAPRVGAALAFFTVLYGGISVLRQQQEPKKPNGLTVSERRPGTVNTAAQLAAPVRRAFVPPPATGDIDPFVSKSDWRPETPNPGPGRPDTATTRRRRPEERDPEPPSHRRNALPRPGASVPSDPIVPPVNVTFPADPTNGSSSGERISAAPPSSSSPPSGRKQSGDGDGGYVRIEMHPASGDSPSKGDEGKPKKEGGDSVSEAQALQNAGRYRDALRSWREVLASSGTRGEVYQNVGICYQRLGERSAARDAYSQAIDVYRGQVARGASADAALRGIDTCRAALELLGA